MAERQGWSVAIRRDDGTEFLCCSEHGILPPVWHRSSRKFAVEHKRELIAGGFKARVVRVSFTDVQIVREAGASEDSQPGGAR